MSRGLFLDFDGTLCDSLPALRGVYLGFLKGFGIEGSEVEFQRLNGPSLREVVGELHQLYRLDGDVEILWADYAAKVHAAHGEAVPVPGAAQVLATACEKGWTVAIVTSSRHSSVETWLRRHGYESMVSDIVGGDEVSRRKPDPEPYRIALARTRCDPASSMAVEDSLHGLASSTGAGLPTWLVGDEQPKGTIPLLRGRLNAFADLVEKL